MPYGTDAFIDGKGDFKQPTIIDYDKEVGIVYNDIILSPEEKEEVLSQFKTDQDRIFEEILNTNPVYGGVTYQHLTYAKDSKLAWDKTKLESLKSDVNWLYTLSRYLNKRKKLLLK